MSRGKTDVPLNDVDGDKLELGPYAEGLARFIGRCQTPMNIGVQGEWGSGKTSLMKLVRNRLDEQAASGDGPLVIHHWFETWQYGAVGNADTLGVRLLQDLVLKLSVTPGADSHQLMRMGERLMRAGAAIAPAVGKAFVAGSASKLSGGVLDGGTLASSMSGDGGVQIGDIRTSFEELVQKVVRQQKSSLGLKKKEAPARVVVFVDDLDRIRPGRAVALLEILKNFMDVKDTVFVVACDYDVVREGVKELMGIVDPIKVNAFFHKIFQVPFEMPIASYSVAPLLEDWLAEWLPSGKKHKARARVLARDYYQLVEAALGTNPRAFKRFLNTVDLQCSVDESYGSKNAKDPTRVRIARWEGEDHEVATWVASLLGMFAFQTRWPDIAGYIYFDLLANQDPNVGVRHFERAIRTLSADWVGWDQGEAGVDVEPDPDEQLHALLRRKFAGPKLDRDWRQHPEMEQLAEFAGLWFRALDRSDKEGRGRLDAQELNCIWCWTRRLVGSSGTTSKRRGKWAFHEQVLSQYPKSGDAYRGLCDAIQAWATEIPSMSCWYNRDGLGVGLQSGGAKTKVFMRCYLDAKLGPIVRFRAAKGLADRYFDLEGLEALGSELVAVLVENGFQVTSSQGSYLVAFNSGHKDGVVSQMDAVMRAFKLFIDGACALRPPQPDIPKDDDDDGDDD